MLHCIVVVVTLYLSVHYEVNIRGVLLPVNMNSFSEFQNLLAHDRICTLQGEFGTVCLLGKIA